MTKDEMRAFLAQAVPAAIADGRAYVVRRPSASRVRELPNEAVQVQTKPVRPMRILPRQGVNGAGFKIPTFKPRSDASPNDMPFTPRDATARIHPAYFCDVCDGYGADCTC